MRMITAAEVFVCDILGAANTFGDVLAGHLEMDAAWMRALGLMHGEETANLGQDGIKWTRLITRR